MAVFEGIRAYETSQGPGIFRLTEHIERLFSSAQIMGMEIPYTVEELIDATKQTVASTGLDSCYIRPIAYFGYGEMGHAMETLLGERHELMIWEKFPQQGFVSAVLEEAAPQAGILLFCLPVAAHTGVVDAVAPLVSDTASVGL